MKGKKGGGTVEEKSGSEGWGSDDQHRGPPQPLPATERLRVGVGRSTTSGT